MTLLSPQISYITSWLMSSPHTSVRRETVDGNSPIFPQQTLRLTCIVPSLPLPLHLNEELPFPIKADPPLVCWIQSPPPTQASSMSPLSWIIPININTPMCSSFVPKKREGNCSLNLSSLPRCHLIILLPFPAKLLNFLWAPSLPHLPFFLACTQLSPACTPPWGCSHLGPQFDFSAARPSGQLSVLTCPLSRHLTQKDRFSTR